MEKPVFLKRLSDICKKDFYMVYLLCIRALFYILLYFCNMSEIIQSGEDEVNLCSTKTSEVQEEAKLLPYTQRPRYIALCEKEKSRIPLSLDETMELAELNLHIGEKRWNIEKNR